MKPSMIEVDRQLKYDPETGLFIRKRIEEKTQADKTRNTRFAGKLTGRITVKGYVRISIGNYGYCGHHIAWLLVYGVWPTDLIDHINGIRNDNRICNLREASAVQNQHNRKLNRNNLSGLQGVSFRKDCKKWRAEIVADRRRIYLGSFETKEEASKAYLAAKEKHHPFQPSPREMKDFKDAPK